ncbi:hypothetical protein FEM33_17120 [Dyadobacter flavalbus]|uniref:Uncharacterized protein n=1 Tax=Dyadobacter flavalbus TaxID=2579942 RepID=A0A5M8QQQ6_9BACT|nr:hypothetical protein [Dyadobacter flavalbus]KAA6438409.1 hypothetical protein FEM33_17120 [Dyadobacter flavalbus]
MKILFSTVIIMIMLACNKPADKASVNTDTTASVSVESEVKPDQLITPGKGIGHLTIGLPVDSAITRLGRPDSSDAAMGSALMAWYSKDAGKHRTAVFAGRNMGNEDISRIKKIMVSSPWFRTGDGVATGTLLTDIKRSYTLKQVDDLTARQKGLQVFDDNEKGITFDIDSASGKCTAITVHTAHESPQSYINMH